MPHEGWANYETWAVKLGMNNDQGSQEYWKERTEETWREAEDDDTFTRKENATLLLADHLKGEHEDALPELEGFAADLLTAAFGEVDWHEIAENLLNDADQH